MCDHSGEEGSPGVPVSMRLAGPYLWTYTSMIIRKISVARSTEYGVSPGDL